MTNTAATAVPAARPTRRTGWLRDAWRYTQTRIGLTIVTLLLLTAVLGPFLAPHSPTEFVSTPYARPGGEALLGTDRLGRDVLTRFLFGGRSVIVMAALSAFIGVALGTLLALAAGFTGRVVDEVLMRTSDVVLAFPPIVLALLFLSIFGPAPWIIVLTVALSHVPRTARVLRAAVVNVSRSEYVMAATAMGYKRWSVRVTEILPNITGPLMVEMGLKLTYSIALVASLGFLGLGLQPPAADWGLMINENRIALGVQPYSVLVPVLTIALLTIGFNMLTDGLARALALTDREVGDAR
jgi:peptide/nickel transport system permease protein